MTEPNPYNQIGFGKHKGARWRDLSRSYLNSLIESKTPIADERAKLELSRRKKAKQAQRPGGLGTLTASRGKGCEDAQLTENRSQRPGNAVRRQMSSSTCPRKPRSNPPDTAFLGTTARCHHQLFTKVHIFDPGEAERS